LYHNNQMKVTDMPKRLLATKGDRIFAAIFTVLVFSLGYFIGDYVSEANKETPIVFKTKDTPQFLTNEDVAKLSGFMPSPKAQAAVVEQTGNVAGSEVKGNYVASVNGEKYYDLSCSEVKRINDANKIFFLSEREALDSGYQPSACVIKKK